MTIDRRIFVKGTLLSGAGLAAGATPRAQTETAGRKETFRLQYAPHFGMFRHHAGRDLVDQIEFMADEGFTAIEDNGMKGRGPEVQDRVRAALEKHGMTMGVFVAHADFENVTFATDDRDASSKLVAQMKKAVEVAKRVGAQWCTVVPGTWNQGLTEGFQTAYVINNLERCAEVCEPAGLAMVLEPLNRRDHPGLFLTRIPQAYQICRAVGSPSCKILDDLYHQQVHEGNLIPNLDRAWSEIAYFQVGDNPGRKEPTTGEINYKNIFRHLHRKGFKGVVGMEHGNARPGKEGERAVIEAYRECDSF